MSVVSARRTDPEEFGPYLVYEELGRGGMAVVHRAESRTPGGRRGPIALKRLLPHASADVELVRSFVEEARVATRFDHPNIARTFSIGRADGAYFMAMEYIAGPTLLQLAKQCDWAAGPIPQAVVIELVLQVLGALDHVHNARDHAGNPLSVIHRDVSMANIIIARTGLIKLIDFGIAKARGSNIHTQAGFIKGKFCYVAPEYLRGTIDARADLFAVGVVAHELLSGRRLFLGKNDSDTLSRLLGMPIPRPSDRRRGIPPELDEIVLTALSRDPDQRWQSAKAMRVALANFAREHECAIKTQQLREWIEWAFAQQPAPQASVDEPTDASFSVDDLDDAEVSREAYAPADEPGAVARSVAELETFDDDDAATTAVAEPAPPAAAPRAPRTAPVMLWMLALLLVLAGAALLAIASEHV